MKEYKCINCGETVEKDKKCTCHICGYMMYEMPFDRLQLLKSEIKNYLLNSLDYDVNNNWFSAYREDNEEKIYLSDDKKRFPSFKKIFDYTLKANKTEEFLERLNKSVDNLKKYYSSSFSNKYIVDTGIAEQQIDFIDESIEELFKIASSEIKISDINFSEISLKYTESPDSLLFADVLALLNKINELLDKISKFIKTNRIFGAFFKRNTMPEISIKKNNDRCALINRQIESVQNILDKKYVVDILSDGSDEVLEMLDCFWKSICLIMNVPVFLSESIYLTDNKEIIGTDNFLNYLKKIISERYKPISEKISADNFLSELSEKQLFNIYDSYVKRDKSGYFGINAATLLSVGKSEEKLNALVGLEPIKKSIRKIKAYSIANKKSDNLNLHMCFYGNPGTGKTEVARIIAGILHENGILPTKNVIEVDRRGLVAEYVGQTAEKTMEVVRSAMGGVLFIDEAYALFSEESKSDYGKEAISTLIKAMEDYRGKFCVILAGYKNQMLDMIKVNPGFQSRIQFALDFPNYNRDELKQISKIMLSGRDYEVSEAALDKMLDITDVLRKKENFANAREMRNIIEQVIMCQNVRVCAPDNRYIEVTDVNQYIQDEKITLPTSENTAKSKILSGEDELEQLIGLDSIKRMIRKIKAYAKKNHTDSYFNLNMCFMGNPGTGKTEVARILSRLLYDAGVLAEAKLVETDSSGLIGRYVGETAPKTIAKVRDALGGVLFIDEAYALVDANGENSSYGDEAIATLIKEMEDKRGQICVIFAGYQEEMKRLISSNPGFASRIQFQLNFPDYDNDELKLIAENLLNKKGYTINSVAMDKFMELIEYFRKQPNFANARTVRNTLDQIIMNQNLRVEDDEENFEIILSDVEDFIFDENIDFSSSGNKQRKIGF